MIKENRIWKIAVDEARGFFLDVLDPLIRLVRWIRRSNEK